jgi:hypothetical protein
MRHYDPCLYPYEELLSNVVIQSHLVWVLLLGRSSVLALLNIELLLLCLVPNVLVISVESSTFRYGSSQNKGLMILRLRPAHVPRLGLAPCHRPPLWPYNTQIRIFATHKSLPLPRRLSSPREGKPTPTSTPQGGREDVNELKRRLKFIPDRWRAYAQLARVDKPIGTVLLFLPCGPSSFLALSPISR